MTDSASAWKAAVLPLNDARDGAEMSGGGAGRQGGGQRTQARRDDHHMLAAARPGQSAS